MKYRSIGLYYVQNMFGMSKIFILFTDKCWLNNYIMDNYGTDHSGYVASMIRYVCYIVT